jgi:hypothetical protein
MPRSGAAVLSDLPRDSRIEIACSKCDRQAGYRVYRLMAQYGDIGLSELLSILTRDCPASAASGINDRCKAFYPDRAK